MKFLPFEVYDRNILFRQFIIAEFVHTRNNGCTKYFKNLNNEILKIISFLIIHIISYIIPIQSVGCYNPVVCYVVNIN